MQVFKDHVSFCYCAYVLCFSGLVWKSNSPKHKHNKLFSLNYTHLKNIKIIITFEFLLYCFTKQTSICLMQNIHIFHLQVPSLHFSNLKISHNAAVTIQVNHHTTHPTTQPKTKQKGILITLNIAVQKFLSIAKKGYFSLILQKNMKIIFIVSCTH